MKLLALDNIQKNPLKRIKIPQLKIEFNSLICLLQHEGLEISIISPLKKAILLNC